jgi:outer membrane lipoprotein SlyB
MKTRRFFASFRHLPVPLTGALLLAGCESTSSTPTRPVYSASQTGQVITHEAGLVMAVEEVLIQAPSSYEGAPGTGSQIGSAVGRGALSGNPMVLAGAIGGIFGAKAGAGMDNQIGDKITIAMDDGKTVTIIQARDRVQPMMPGERVVLERSSGTTRVVREGLSDDNLSVPVTVR